MASVSSQQIYGYLLQRGVSPASAAGILSNIKHESSFNPAAVGDNGTSGGLFQHHASRWDNLKRYAASTGRSWADWTAQVDFALGEARQMGINLRASDPAAAAREWTLRFERPDNAQVRAEERAREAASFVGGGSGRFPAFMDPGGGGGAPPPPGYGTPPAPMAPGIPPPGVSTAMYDQLYAGYDTMAGLNIALTQNSVEYQRRQQQFANQLAGIQQQGLGLSEQQMALENKYQNDLALLNRNLTKSQQATNEKEWRQIATNIADLQALARQGLTDDRGYYEKQNKLRSDIHRTQRKWLGQQKGFNRRDRQLALRALNNVLKTEAARWGEVRRVHGAETGLAKQKRRFIAQGARETYRQALAESRFVAGEQRREAKSEALVRGARFSPGHTQDLGAIAQQQQLAASGAQVSRDDILRMSHNQLRSELENIGQAYRQGRINYQDAVRQTNNAKQRAWLDSRQRYAGLNFQTRQAGFEARESAIANQQRWRNARLGYLQGSAQRTNQHKRAWIGFESNRANLRAQAEQAARTQAYNNALYGLNLAGVQNTGASYAAQLAQQQAASRYGIDQSYIGGAQGLAGLDQQRAATAGQQLSDINLYAGQPPAGYRTATTAGQRARSAYDPSTTTDRSAGVYVPPGSAYN